MKLYEKISCAVAAVVVTPLWIVVMWRLYWYLLELM